MQVCLDCGAPLPECSKRRKFCDKCRKRRQREANKREALGDVKKRCKNCGGEVPTGRRTYCSDDCAEYKPKKVKAPVTRSALPPEMPGWETTGKSLRQVDAEAREFGLSYGQYTAKIRAHSIEDYLRAQGWTPRQWRATLKKIGEKTKK